MIEIVKPGLTCVWLCATADETEESIIDFLSKTSPPDTPDVKLKDRLYGGFNCGNDENNCHIMVDCFMGSRMKLRGGSVVKCRESVWLEILAENSDQPVAKRQIFCADRPAIKVVDDA